MLQKVRDRLPIFLLTAGHGAVDFYLGVLAVVAPGLAVYLGVPLGDLVFLAGAAALLNNGTQIVAGYVMGRRNLAWILWFGVVLSVLPVFMGYASGYLSLTILVLLGAIGTGLYHPEGALSAHDASGDKAYLGVPLFMAGGACVYAIGTPLSIRIAERFGFPTLAWLALPGLAVGALLLLQHNAKKRKHPTFTHHPRSKRMTKVHAGSMSYWPLLMVAICFGVANGVFISLLASHYELVFGPSARSWAGWALMVLGISGSLFSFWWSALSRKHGFYMITLVSQAVSFPLFVLMAYPPSPVAGLLIAIPLSVFYPNAVYPVAVTMARNASGLTQSMRTSILMGGTAGLSSIAVMASGALIRWGLPSSYLIMSVAACSLASVALALWQVLAARRTAGAVKSL